MKDYNGAENTLKAMESFSASARPNFNVDVARYQEYLDGADLTPEQKEEFLTAVWSIVVTFVGLGYGVHPLQEACGKDCETDALRPVPASDEVRSEDLNIAKPLDKPAPPGKPEVK